jgi:hypothetical protein
MSRLRWSSPIVIVALLLVTVLVALWLFSFIQMREGKNLGTYQTPEEAMYAHVKREYQGVRRVEIGRTERAMLDRLRFIKAYIYADSRLDGATIPPRGYEEKKCFFVKTKGGWAFIRDNKFPRVVALGQLLLGWLG